MIAYGPVPSRRLGRSLGINNIPPKVCTYSCVYCQVGRTLKMEVERREYYPPGRIVAEVSARVREVREGGEEIDYLAFVPDGEPTLDVHLGEELRLLEGLGIPLAVISNGSLMARADVREELMAADWVSLKVDTVDEETWRRVDRPHGSLDLEAILYGMKEFRRDYSGTLVTETMLVAGVNDSERHAVETAEFLSVLKPSTAYVSVPTRPPAEGNVQPPPSERLLHFYEEFSDQVASAEWLIGYEGNAFTAAGDPAENLLSITAVHPMREEAVGQLLDRAGAGWEVVEGLVGDGRMKRVEYEGRAYYLRSPRRQA